MGMLLSFLIISFFGCNRNNNIQVAGVLWGCRLVLIHGKDHLGPPVHLLSVADGTLHPAFSINNRMLRSRTERGHPTRTLSFTFSPLPGFGAPHTLCSLGPGPRRPQGRMVIGTHPLTLHLGFLPYPDAEQMFEA